jgi:hypothetical protein
VSNLVVLVGKDETLERCVSDVASKHRLNVQHVPEASQLTGRFIRQKSPSLILCALGASSWSVGLARLLQAAREAMGLKLLLVGDMPQAELADWARQSRADAFALRSQILESPSEAVDELLPETPKISTSREAADATEVIERAISEHLLNHFPRRGPRCECDLMAAVHSPSTGVMLTHITSLSADGARLMSRQRLAPDLEVQLAFTLRISGELRLKARTIWSGPARNPGMSSTGISFNDLTENDRHAIEAFLESQLPELYA